MLLKFVLPFLMCLPLVGQNLMSNGEFQRELDDWTFGGQNFDWLEDGYTLPGSVSFTFPAGGQKTMEQCAVILDGTEIYTTLHLRGEGNVNAQINVSFYEGSDCTSFLTSEQIFNGSISGDWQSIAHSLTPPIGAIGVRFELVVSGVVGASAEVDTVFVGRYLYPGFDRTYTQIWAKDDFLPNENATSIGSINIPYSRNGVLAFSGTDSNGQEFVISNNQDVWREKDNPVYDSIASLWIAANTQGQVLFETTAGLFDEQLMSGDGPLLATGDDAPATKGRTIQDFIGRPELLNDGSFYFPAKLNDDETVLYHGDDISNPTYSFIFRGFQPVAGFNMKKDGLVNVAVSPNGQHIIAHLKVETGAIDDDDIIVVNGQLIARESATAPNGHIWHRFLALDINDNGDYLFSGQFRDLLDPGRAFICYNGSQFIEPFDVIANVPLFPALATSGIKLNNAGQALMLMVRPGFSMWFFFQDVSAPATARLLLKSGDRIDLNDDNIPETNVRGTGGFATWADLDLDENGTSTIRVGAGPLFLANDVLLEIPAPCIPDASYFAQMPSWPQTNSVLGLLPPDCN